MSVPSMTDPSPFLDPGDAARIAEGAAWDLFALLGAQPCGGAWALRAFIPGAEAVEALDQADGAPLAALEPGPAPGHFAALLPARPAAWRFRARRGGDVWEVEDPYRFGPVLGPQDEHFIAEGSHLRLWERLGAHPMIHEGAEGCVFAVWAPNARRVSVVGDFNGWDGRRHVGAMSCARAGPRGCGRSSPPASGRARPTNTRSWGRTARCSR